MLVHVLALSLEPSFREAPMMSRQGLHDPMEATLKANLNWVAAKELNLSYHNMDT